jgi:hypothetical protein
MINELWGSFPRLLEQNVNGLLETAVPNQTKAFQLYKTCKSEDLWRENFESFSKMLAALYAKPRAARRKGHIDQLLDRPMDAHLYQNFHINFKTASVDERAVTDLASWAHNLIRVSKKSVSAVFSVAVMTETLRAVVNPGPLDKADNIEFDDICEKWKKVVERNFSAGETRELNVLVTELQKINRDHYDLEEVSGLHPLPLLGITPPELDWIKLVRLAALAHAKIPKPPPSQGLRKQSLNELDRVIQLYELVLVTQIDQLMKHRSSTRLTLIDRCDTLIADAEPRAA